VGAARQRRLIGITYQRDSLTTARGPDIAGAHRHTLGSGRAVRSISVGASAGGNLDSLYMVTEEASGGTFHVEVMTRLLSEGFTFSIAGSSTMRWCRPRSRSTRRRRPMRPMAACTLYGLWPLNGKTVAAYLVRARLRLARADHRCQRADRITDFTVSNGAIFVPFGDGVSQGCGDGLFTRRWWRRSSARRRRCRWWWASVHLGRADRAARDAAGERARASARGSATRCAHRQWYCSAALWLRVGTISFGT
jgi:hypothetical protein